VKTLHLPIASIKVEQRYRKDLGDLSALKESIDTNDLLHPVVVTEDYRLLAGQRRLEACRQLGWSTVPVTVIRKLSEAADYLAVERDENTCRKDMTASELADLGQALEQLERPKVQEQHAAASARGGKSKGCGLSTPPLKTTPRGPRTRDTVGQALGMSGVQYNRLKRIKTRAEGGDQQAKDILEAIDRKEMTITGGLDLLLKKDQESGKPSKHRNVEKRIDQITHLAAEGHRASQIAEEIGVSVGHVRSIAREHNVTLPDRAIGKVHHLDHAQIIAETVNAVEGLAFGLKLVGGGLDGIEPQEAKEMATSLSQSLRPLNRLAKQLKEMAS